MHSIVFLCLLGGKRSIIQNVILHVQFGTSRQSKIHECPSVSDDDDSVLYPELYPCLRRRPIASKRSTPYGFSK